MANLNTRAKADRTFDAIVVGSGMSGGWAAKELTEKGLRTLGPERGRMVRPLEGCPTAGMAPWETRYPRGRLPDEIAEHYPVQRRSYVLNEYAQHFLVRRRASYTEAQRFDWIRAIMWADARSCGRASRTG